MKFIISIYEIISCTDMASSAVVRPAGGVRPRSYQPVHSRPDCMAHGGSLCIGCAQILAYNRKLRASTFNLSVLSAHDYL